MKKTVCAVTVILFGLGLLIFSPATEAKVGSILYQDDFSDPKSGWPQGEDPKVGKLAYENGKYLVRTNKRWPSMLFGSPQKELTSFALSVTTKQVTAPSNNNNAYGVMVRYQEERLPKQNFAAYMFLISGDGYWSILKLVDKKLIPLFYWTHSWAIRKGNKDNHLRVVCIGSYLSLIVNGQVLGEIHDQRIHKGRIGLVAITYEYKDKAVEILFDDLVVRSVY